MHTNLNAALEACFSIHNVKRVVATNGKTFRVCSRSAARRLGLKMIARNA